MVYVLCYAESFEEFSRWVKKVGKCVKKGGRFIGVEAWPEHSLEGDFLKYGFEYPTTEKKPGEAIRVYYHFGEGKKLTFDNYWFSTDQWKTALKDARFPDFRWVPMTPTEDNNDKEFWSDFMKNPKDSCFEGVKRLDE